MDLVMSRRIVQALVDLGASHNFLKTEVAKELGLRVSSCGVVVKASKSMEKATTGVSSSIHI
jgi:predicted aspartyl protease